MLDEMTMQEAIDSGLAWQLEGSYGRAAMQAIKSGECMLGHEGRFDSYGSYVPSRYEVEPRTPGSPEYAGLTIERESVDYLVEFRDGSQHTIDAPQLFGAFANKHLDRFAPVTVLGVAP